MLCCLLPTSISDDEDPAPTTLGGLVLQKWTNRKAKLEHEYAVTAWALCLLPGVRADVVDRMDGSHRRMIELVIERLHTAPSANPCKKLQGLTETQIIDIFWDEFDAFQNVTGTFGKRPGQFTTLDALQGRSYLWHKKYSLPHTKVLGFVACRTTSKLTGIGAAERAWGDTKYIKSGKRSHLSGESTEKRSILYTSARIDEARIKRQAMEKIDAGPNAMFGDDDMK